MTPKNALKSSGETVVLPSEDPAQYERFAQSFRDDLKPSGAIEEQLVQTIVDDTWRLNRTKLQETEMFASVGVFLEQVDALATLSAYQHRLSESFHRNLTKLRKMQAERRKA
jgi:hypothetical protein